MSEILVTRRNFLKGLIITSVVSATGVVTKNVEAALNHNLSENELIDQEKLKSLDKSEKYIGESEMNFFKYFFRVNDDTFMDKVKEIQFSNGLNDDGIIGPQTLAYIYLKYYSRNIPFLDNDRKKRLSIYYEIITNGYQNKNGAIYRNLNVFSRNDYYGSFGSINETNSFINKDFIGEFPIYDSNVGTTIIISKFKGKNILRFYIDGNLIVATYVSVGRNRRTPGGNFYGWAEPDKLHTSLSYPENRGGSVMPYAVHVTGAIRMHGSDGTINGSPASHGCIRVPLFYMKEIFERVKVLGKENVKINTRNVY